MSETGILIESAVKIDRILLANHAIRANKEMLGGRGGCQIIANWGECDRWKEMIPKVLLLFSSEETRFREKGCIAIGVETAISSNPCTSFV